MMPVVKEITDFNAPELDIYARLTENQLLNRHEPEKGIFIAESPKVIERALDAGCVPISFLAERREAEGTGRELVEKIIPSKRTTTGKSSRIPCFLLSFISYPPCGIQNF